MYQYTTPTHKFTLSVSLDKFLKVKIIYAQKDKVLFVKTLDDIVEDSGYTATITLSQEESGRFDERFPCQIQWHVQTKDGAIMASSIYETSVQKVLDGVI